MANKLKQQLRPFFTKLTQERPSHFPPHAKLIIGVSGGPDSLALLHVLKSLYEPHDLIVGHLNHQLRPSAVAEAEFVRSMARAWHIPCYVQETDVAQVAAEQNLSLEEAGRWVRYRYFADLARREEAHVIVVAHHADDQAETVLMHLLRGTGLSGLRGMLPVASLPGSEEYVLIRPFLHTSRATIESYCQQHNLQPILDESNHDTRFLRNRLRHELIPYLAEYDPQIKTHLQQLAVTVAADEDLLEATLAASWQVILHAQTSDSIQLKRAVWLSLPLSLQRRSLRQAVQQLRPSARDIGFQTIEQARQIIENGHTGAQSSLPGDLTLLVGYEYLLITADPRPLPVDLPQLSQEQPVPLNIPGQVSLANGWQITASLEAKTDWQKIQDNRDLGTVYATIDETDTLTVRGRQQGERLRPLGMKGQTTKLKDLMINRKIPVHLRANWPLVVCNDQVIWVVGHQLDERVKAVPEAAQVVKLQCQRT